MRRFLSSDQNREIAVGISSVELRVFARSSFGQSLFLSIVLPIAIAAGFFICGNLPWVQFIALAVGVAWVLTLLGYVQEGRDPWKPILSLELTSSRLSWRSAAPKSEATWDLDTVERIEIDTYLDAPAIAFFSRGRQVARALVPSGSFHVALLLEWFLRESRVVPMRFVGEMKLYDAAALLDEFPGLDIAAIRAIGEPRVAFDVGRVRHGILLPTDGDALRFAEIAPSGTIQEPPPFASEPISVLSALVVEVSEATVLVVQRDDTKFVANPAKLNDLTFDLFVSIDRDEIGRVRIDLLRGNDQVAATAAAAAYEVLAGWHEGHVDVCVAEEWTRVILEFDGTSWSGTSHRLTA